MIIIKIYIQVWVRKILGYYNIRVNNKLEIARESIKRWYRIQIDFC